MSEDAPNIATVNGISEFLQKNGLCHHAGFGWSVVCRPAA